MTNRKTDEFLDLYKRLENAAVKIVGDPGRGSVIVRLSNHPRYEKYRNEFDCCREVRNLLSHEVRIDGDFAVTPSDSAIDFLQRMLAMVETPPTALSRATPRNRLLSAKPGDPVLALARAMQAKGISHVPLLSDGAVTGVFSENVIFEALIQNQSLQITEETPLSAFASFLPIARTLGKTYQFLPETATVDDANDLFDRFAGKGRKLKILFLTKHGRPEESLLGLLSPYDVLDRG